MSLSNGCEPSLRPGRRAVFQTEASLRALVDASSVEIQFENDKEKATTQRAGVLCSTARRASAPFMEPPLRVRASLQSPSRSLQSTSSSVVSIGPPYLQVFRFSLPSHLLSLLDRVKDACEEHVSSSAEGWKTNLFSLTKQDVAVNGIPGARSLVEPINDAVLSSAENIWGCPLYVDWHQPHVLKYDESHKSVPVHYDMCSVTISVMMSKSDDYEGGGCFIPALGAVLRLQYGDVLVHPGRLLHAGSQIHSGTRYLLMYFCEFA